MCSFHKRAVLLKEKVDTMDGKCTKMVSRTASVQDITGAMTVSFATHTRTNPSVVSFFSPETYELRKTNIYTESLLVMARSQFIIQKRGFKCTKPATSVVQSKEHWFSAYLSKLECNRIADLHCVQDSS
jgi:hypothetical protein